MGNQAPTCPIALPVPLPANPEQPIGFQLIPPGATLAQVIQIVNKNFQKISPAPPTTHAKTNAAVAGGGFRVSLSGQGSNSGGNWVLSSQPTKKIRIYHVNDDGTTDKTQFVDVQRPTKTVLKNLKTGEILTIPGIPDQQSGE